MFRQPECRRNFGLSAILSSGGSRILSAFIGHGADVETIRSRENGAADSRCPRLSGLQTPEDRVSDRRLDWRRVPRKMGGPGAVGGTDSGGEREAMESEVLQRQGEWLNAQVPGLAEYRTLAKA